MIRVPRVSEPSLQEPTRSATRVLPVQDQTGQQLQEVGQGLSVLGRGVAQLEESIDASRIKGADALLSEASRSKLQEYQSLAGRSAIDARKAALQDFQEQRRKIEGTLTTPRQREVFAEAAREREIRYAASIDGHFRDQSRAYEIGESTALAQAAMADYVAFGDPIHRNTMLAEVDRVGDLYGYGPAQKAQARTQALTQMHEQVLERLVRGGDTAAAANYLEAAAGELDPQKARSFRGAVARAQEADDSARMAIVLVQELSRREVVPAVGDVIGEAQTWEQAQQPAMGPEAPYQPVYEPLSPTRPTFVAEAEKILDGELMAGRITAKMHNDVLERVAKKHKQAVEIEATETKDALQQAEQWLMADPMRSVQDMAIADPRMHALLLERGHIPALNAFAESDRRHSTDPKALMAARTATPEQLREMSPNRLFSEFWGKLSQGEFSRLMAEQAKAKGEATPADTWLLSKSARLERLARTPAFGLLPADKSGDANMAPERRKRYEDWLLGVEQTLKARGVKDGDREAFDAVLTELAADVVNGGGSAPQELREAFPGFFDDQQPGRAFSALSKEDQARSTVITNQGEVTFGQVPKSQVDDIVDLWMTVHGRMPSAKTIVEYWVDRGRPKQ